MSHKHRPGTRPTYIPHSAHDPAWRKNAKIHSYFIIYRPAPYFHELQRLQWTTDCRCGAVGYYCSACGHYHWLSPERETFSLNPDPNSRQGQIADNGLLSRSDTRTLVGDGVER